MGRNPKRQCRTLTNAVRIDVGIDPLLSPLPSLEGHRFFYQGLGFRGLGRAACRMHVKAHPSNRIEPRAPALAHSVESHRGSRHLPQPSAHLKSTPSLHMTPKP